MLFLIGLGIGYKEISVRGLEALKSSDSAMMESYTVPVPSDYVKYLEGEFQKPILMIKRSDMEENMRSTLANAKNGTLAVLVPGDPLIATTHHKFIDKAHEMGIETAIFHASSVLSSAISESGLDAYKFGPTATVPFWSNNYKPTSFINLISKNLDNKEHTLLLLDLDHRDSHPMKLSEAFQLIDSAEKATSIKITGKSKKWLAMGNIGREGQLIMYSDIDTLKKNADKFDGKVSCIIVPSEVSFAEEESVSSHSV